MACAEVITQRKMGKTQSGQLQWHINTWVTLLFFSFFFVNGHPNTHIYAYTYKYKVLMDNDHILYIHSFIHACIHAFLHSYLNCLFILFFISFIIWDCIRFKESFMEWNWIKLSWVEWLHICKHTINNLFLYGSLLLLLLITHIHMCYNFKILLFMIEVDWSYINKIEDFKWIIKLM